MTRKEMVNKIVKVLEETKELSLEMQASAILAMQSEAGMLPPVHSKRTQGVWGSITVKENTWTEPAPIEKEAVDERFDKRISFGRRYKNKKFSEIPEKDFQDYIKWLEGSSIREGTTLWHQVTQLKKDYEAYLRASKGIRHEKLV